MGLIPYSLKPSVVIRRKALRAGVLGPSVFWKVVAAGVFGRSTLKKVFGRQVEVISTETAKPGQFVNIISAAPLSRRAQRRTGITRAMLHSQALADVAAAAAARPPRRRRFRRS